MVLSNRKIKQKLRAEIAVSLTSSATTADGSDSANPNPVSNSQTQSLKLLLDSVTQKPRLSKREKKRRSGHDSETVNSKKGGGDVDVDVDENKNTGGVEEESKNFDVVGDENGGENVEKKKRKREEGEIGELGEGEGGFVKEAKKPNAKTNKKKKKQKQKKRKAKIGEEEDNNGGVGGGVVGNEEPNKGSERQVKIKWWSGMNLANHGKDKVSKWFSENLTLCNKISDQSGFLMAKSQNQAKIAAATTPDELMRIAEEMKNSMASMSQAGTGSDQSDKEKDDDSDNYVYDSEDPTTFFGHDP